MSCGHKTHYALKLGYALKDVPDDLCNREMCLMDITQDGLALIIVPDDLCTKEMCFCCRRNQEGMMMEYVPDEFQKFRNVHCGGKTSWYSFTRRSRQIT